MNLILHLLKQKQSKKNRDAIIDTIYDNPNQMDILMDCFFDDSIRLCQHASWPVGIIGEQKPSLITPYLDKMIKAIKAPKHEAIVRNTFRVLQFVDIPEELEGEVYDKCFQYLDDPKTPVAIRAFSMTVLTNLAIKYPALKEELVAIIELHYPTGSPGFKSRAKREIKRMK